MFNLLGFPFWLNFVGSNEEFWGKNSSVLKVLTWVRFFYCISIFILLLSSILYIYGVIREDKIEF